MQNLKLIVKDLKVAYLFEVSFKNVFFEFTV